MSFASDTSDALRAAVEAALQGIVAPVQSARHAQAALRDADDLLPAMQASVGVILAMEAMEEAAKSAKAAARIALAAAMSSTGATTVQTDMHSVSLRDAPRTARIVDANQIPPEYMQQPPPKPDMVAIGKRLRDGGNILGTTLNNQGEQTITIRSRT